MSRLIVVANRTPTPGPAAGGLAVALRQPLQEREGFWFGWSGKTDPQPSKQARIDDVEGISVAVVDLTRDAHAAYYAGFSNSVLWPAFHQRLDLASIDSEWYEGYRGVNTQFAEALKPLIRPDDMIWVHDYHLIPLASELRARGVGNRIGFYLHIPFPTPEALLAIPHQAELMHDLAAYDLVGLQAERDLSALRDSIARLPLADTSGRLAEAPDFSTTELAVVPIGSDPDAFVALVRSPAAAKMRKRTEDWLRDRKLILGVDRLDYSKGLPQRVEAFERLLADNPDLRRRVHYLQVASPSRDVIQEYREIGRTLDAAVGHVMGRFSEPDWQPITYVKRAYTQASLAGLYRVAKVGLVTPLRDGMNLVAHEYVATQDPEDPGVLVLSHFAGAAEILDGALLVNAFDPAETANALRVALSMALEERRERWQTLNAAIRRYSVHAWTNAFLGRLAPPPPSERISA